LTILAGLVVLGLLIEATRYGTLLWATKLPLCLALAIAWARARGGPERG
jgi:hypothetical protein